MYLAALSFNRISFGGINTDERWIWSWAIN